MGSDPMINAIINKMYNMMTESLSIEIISSKILPVLIPYLAEPSINKTEFMHFNSRAIILDNSNESLPKPIIYNRLITMNLPLRLSLSHPKLQFLQS